MNVIDAQSLHLVFLIGLFVAAFLYASVGHGGASGYLALMALYQVGAQTMRPTALLMNSFVSLISFTLFVRSSTFHRKLFLCLALGSVPAAYVGSLLSFDETVYRKTLAVLLVVPALGLFRRSGAIETETKDFNAILAVSLGMAIGLVSGLIGIGGGVLLSPVLLYMRWATVREAASISALFIFVNSVSGLTGLASKGFQVQNFMYAWMTVAVIGGLCGSYLGSRYFSSPMLRRILAVVIIVAGIKLFFQS